MRPIQHWDSLLFWRSTTWEFLSQKILRVTPNLCPPERLVFEAFNKTPYKKVKAVILGQDPYHTRGVATGLAFSTWPHVKPIPPSLRNIFKEYMDDLGLPLPRTGDLSGWADQGVLLLNTCLTTEEGQAGAHRNLGWEKLTIEVLSRLSKRGNCVFILWGKDAGEYRGLIDEVSNCIISAPHPSPLSARKGFFGHSPFSRCNTYLESCGIEPINWRLR